MMGLFRRWPRPAPSSDMQSRLRHIEERCDHIHKGVLDGSIPPNADTVADLAYLVGYVATIVGKHLQDGER